MTPELLQPDAFVAAVQPLLEQRDAHGLQHLLRTRWTHEQIKSLLQCEDADARKVACLALALVGGKCAIPCVAKQLKDPDPVVNQMAEHALWSIWLRGGVEEANRELCRGTQSLNRRDIPQAMAHFTRAIEIDPTFAEAYNQRAIAHFMAEEFDQSISDCREAITRMSCHFGAWAGMGHCHAHQSRLGEAITCYERALEINPHLEGIREVLVEFKRSAH